MISSTERNLRLEQLMPLILERLEAGQTVTFSPRGVSMLPMLRQGMDTVELSPVPERLNKYDLPLYQRKSGQFVLHRIVERDDGAVRKCWGRKKAYPTAVEDLRYTLLGDAQWDLEPDVRADQILAVATAFIRKGRRWECDSPAYRRNRLLWHRLLPLRRVWMWWDRRLHWRFRRLFPYRYKA